MVNATAIENQMCFADTIGDTVERFLAKAQGGVASLREIYTAAQRWPNESVRCSIYRDKKNRFKRVAKGVYLLIGQTSASLLIHGDSRNLDEIEDASISAIINDHPWENRKAHKSGNQKDFADYDTFEYTQDDFIQKARVLQDGGYLAEFLPVRSFTNREYLNKVEEMAQKAGLDFYANLIWRKAPEGVVNTGRTTKGVEQIVIFSKGKARCLNAGGKAYKTSNILNFEVDIPANRGKAKTHQAEKPIALYKYLLNQLSRESDICLDQYGGSCNMAQAAIECGRFAIVYELFKGYIKNAVNRFGMFTVCEKSPIAKDEEQPMQQHTFTLETIPRSTTEAQLDFLQKVQAKRPDLLERTESVLLAEKSSALASSVEINEVYKNVVKRGFESYCLPEITGQLAFSDCAVMQRLYDEIDDIIKFKANNRWLEPQYGNLRLEAQTFVAFCIGRKHNLQVFSDAHPYLEEYLSYLKAGGFDVSRSERVLGNMFFDCVRKAG